MFIGEKSMVELRQVSRGVKQEGARAADQFLCTDGPVVDWCDELMFSTR